MNFENLNRLTTYTPKVDQQNLDQSSMSRPSKSSDFSYRDSESLGFALTERKKAH